MADITINELASPEAAEASWAPAQRPDAPGRAVWAWLTQEGDRPTADQRRLDDHGLDAQGLDAQGLGAQGLDAQGLGAQGLDAQDLHDRPTDERQSADRGLAALAPDADARHIAPGRRRLAVAVAAALLIVGAMDAATTELALSTGVAREANPIVRGIQNAIGSFWILPKMAVHALLAAVVMRFPMPLTLIVMGTLAAVIFFVSVNNLEIYLDAIREV